MYKEGLLNDKDIYADLAEIIAGQKKGRESDEEFIYFNSVGLSDVYKRQCECSSLRMDYYRPANQRV